MTRAYVMRVDGAVDGRWGGEGWRSSRFIGCGGSPLEQSGRAARWLCAKGRSEVAERHPWAGVTFCFSGADGERHRPAPARALAGELRVRAAECEVERARLADELLRARPGE